MEMKWEELFPGVRQCRLGSAGDTLTELAGTAPRTQRLREFPVCPQSAPPIHLEQSAGRFLLQLPLRENEVVYGPGLNFRTLRNEHKVIHLRADHFGGKDNGRTHAPVPFYLTSAGYGLFLDTPAPVSYYIGTAHRKDAPIKPVAKDRNTDADWQPFNAPDYMEICVEASSLKLVLFEAEGLLPTVQKFNLYCGGGFLPPRWGLGFWFRTPLAYSGADVEAVVRRFREHDFPLSVLGLEPGWQSSSYPCTYEWSSERFPDPARFVQGLQAQGVRVNLWENPYLAPKSGLYRQLEDKSCSHMVWCGIAPDYTLPDVRAILQEQHENAHLRLGVSGYKLDESDGYDAWLWPDHAVFPSGRNGRDVRNVYGLLFQRMTYEAFRQRNQRTYGLTRSTNAGGVTMPYVLYNDCYDFDEYTTALCNCGFIGALWCPEVRSAANAEDWLRRFQLVALSPMAMLNAWADGTEPWSFPEVAPEVRTALRLRESLIPYLYSAFARYYLDGVPPFRALVMDFGDFLKDSAQKAALDGTANPYPVAQRREVTDQYMMGESIMVVVVKPGQHERDVILPPGNWFDFYTGRYAGNGEVVRLTIGPKDPLPLFVRDGAVIPRQEEGALRITRYGQAQGAFLLYEDDGDTFAYERGEYRLQALE